MLALNEANVKFAFLEYSDTDTKFKMAEKKTVHWHPNPNQIFSVYYRPSLIFVILKSVNSKHYFFFLILYFEPFMTKVRVDLDIGVLRFFFIIIKSIYSKFMFSYTSYIQYTIHTYKIKNYTVLQN